VRPLWRSRFIIAVFSAIAIAGALAAADQANPPDTGRARVLSQEIRDRDGKLLRPFLAADGSWRLATTPADVSARYLAILKAYEDQRFDSHWGVDPLAVGRALLQFGEAGHVVSGASTITMQVARLLDPGHKRGIGTKLLQTVRALQLELRYSKDEILAMYLTLAPFGGNLEGVRAASLAYFGKEPKSLTLAEAALLVALPQSPERQRPDRHPAAAAAARDKVLVRLQERGELPADEAAEARTTALPALRLPLPMIAPRMAERLRRERKGEHIIVTNIDGALQRAVEDMALAEAVYFEDRASMAIVVVNTETREVVAEVGGTDYWGPAGNIDLASQPRSPGSALKPFIYGLAFDDLALHPATMMQDIPTMFGDYAPRNFDGGFNGQVMARDALRLSLNVPAVLVLERVGPVRFTMTLENSGANVAFPAREKAPSLPIALGGVGISLRDITMLYAGIAGGGEVRPLRATRDAPEGKPFRLFGPAAAWYLRDILSNASLPDGWAMGQGLRRTRDVAFKTGTSYGYRDAWSIGFSNDYTVGIWVGRPDGAPRAGHMGRNDAGPILFKVFDLLPPDRRGKPPRPPDAIVAANPGQLPAALRVFVRKSEAARAVRVSHVPPPEISFPPDGAVVSLPRTGDEDSFIALKVTGGRAPFTWMVDGRVVGNYDRFEQITFTPGVGFSRITVIDADGNSATSRVRFKAPR
jgi:penicillin-binding protein 1C